MPPKLMPPTYFMVLLVLSIVLHVVFPIKTILHAPYTYLGLFSIVFGIILNLWADALFKKRSTPVKPHELPTSLEVSGPFRISRHPMYLGMAAILLGLAILLGSAITFVFPVLFILVMELLFIPMEDRNLEQAFGAEYQAYKKRVRRWI
jgi:protein-S-isoprenylcysteine O-methyltransferase Ste14